MNYFVLVLSRFWFLILEGNITSAYLLFPDNMLKILFLTVLGATVSSKSLRTNLYSPTTTTHTEDINEAKATVVTSDHVKTMNVSFF